MATAKVGGASRRRRWMLRLVQASVTVALTLHTVIAAQAVVGDRFAGATTSTSLAASVIFGLVALVAVLPGFVVVWMGRRRGDVTGSRQ